MPDKSYKDRKRREAGRQREMALDGRDIGPIPDVADPVRRLACSRSFQAHCEAYHAATFCLPWSPDHLKVIAQIEEAVLRGGLFATAMPRGSGKTSLAEVACLWALLHGHRDFVCLIASDEGAASGMLSSLKSDLEVSDLLCADFPEVCLAIQHLEGIANRCNGQLYRQSRTRIAWTADEIRLPSLRPLGWDLRPDHRCFVRSDGSSLASGAVVKVAGLTGGIRGMKHKRPDGRSVRPSLVVVDDPQTDQSARSPSQCQARERILAGAVLGLAGPGVKISGICPCTVIAPGDLADRILDRNQHPEWNGTRTKMVYAFPTDAKLWEEYTELRRSGLRAGDGGKAATEFYRRKRAAMDSGSVVAWPERFNPDELSAIQHAMNLRIDRGEFAFAAEFQNEPLPETPPRPDDLTAEQILGKLNQIDRGIAPAQASRLTAFIDVQGELLYYAVLAWEDDFTGYVVSYGSYPDQKRAYYSLRDARRTLTQATGSPDLEGRLYAGLTALTSELLGREWPRDDGGALRIERCLIDANWGDSTPTVKQFCRQSPHAALLTPSHGKFIGPDASPIADWPQRAGERSGLNWRLRAMEKSRAVRSVVYDTNFWKNFLCTRLSVPLGSRTSLSLFGAKPEAHRMLADHLMAEYRETKPGRGRTIDVWHLKPGGPDNHLLDCLVGCCVAASLQGVALPEGGPLRAPRARVKLSDLRRQKRA